MQLCLATQLPKKWSGIYLSSPRWVLEEYALRNTNGALLLKRMPSLGLDISTVESRRMVELLTWLYIRQPGGFEAGYHYFATVETIYIHTFAPARTIFRPSDQNRRMQLLHLA